MLTCRRLVEKVVRWCTAHTEYCAYGPLFLIAYAFLLRLPSEALPIMKGRAETQAAMFREGTDVCLRLARRWRYMCDACVRSGRLAM